jgi:hypothetical protein
MFMLRWSPRVLSEWNPEFESRPVARLGFYVKPPAELFRPRAHVVQPVASAPVGMGGLRRSLYEATPIVGNLAEQLIAADGNGQRHRPTPPGVPDDIIDPLFKDEEQVTTLLRADLEPPDRRGGAEFPGDAFGFENVGGELPDALHDAA